MHTNPNPTNPTVSDLDALIREAIAANAQAAAEANGREAEEYANATRTLVEALTELTRTADR